VITRETEVIENQLILGSHSSGFGPVLAVIAQNRDDLIADTREPARAEPAPT